MIDIQHESLILLSEAPRYIPGRPNISTLYRWFQRGARGTRLETVVVGNKRFTSHEAIQRFVERTTANSPGAALPPSRPTSRQREAAIKRAERELEAAGI